MGSRNKPPLRAKDMLRRYEAGETFQEIGDAYGITRERVRQILDEFFGRVGRRRRPVVARRNADIVGLRAEGVGVSTIAEAYGLSHARIYSILRRGGRHD